MAAAITCPVLDMMYGEDGLVECHLGGLSLSFPCERERSARPPPPSPPARDCRPSQPPPPPPPAPLQNQPQAPCAATWRRTRSWRTTAHCRRRTTSGWRAARRAAAAARSSRGGDLRPTARATNECKNHARDSLSLSPHRHTCGTHLLLAARAHTQTHRQQTRPLIDGKHTRVTERADRSSFRRFLTHENTMFPMPVQAGMAGYPMVLGPDGQPMPMMMQAAPVRRRERIVLWGRARASLACFVARALPPARPKATGRRFRRRSPHLMRRPVRDRFGGAEEEGLARALVTTRRSRRHPPSPSPPPQTPPETTNRT